MKKLCILLLTLCLLVGMLSVYASAAEATDSLASDYLSSDMQAKLKEKTSYDRVIKVYTLGMYFHDFVEGDSWEKLLTEALGITYYVNNEEAESRNMLYGYVYRDDAFEKKTDSTHNIDMYNWLSNVLDSSYLRIVGVGEKKIQNIYCIITYSPPRASMIVYDTEDGRYYALYNRGRNEEPTYFTVESFEAYVHAWVDEYNSKPQYDENGEPYAGGFPTVSIPAANFDPLMVSLSAVAMENPDELLTEPVTEIAEGTDEVTTDAPTDSGCAAVSYGTVGLCLLTLAIALPCLEKKKIKR